MKKFSIQYKIVAIILVFAFTFQSLESINSHTYSTTNYNTVYICGPHFCTDLSPAHLSYFCDDYHKL